MITSRLRATRCRSASDFIRFAPAASLAAALLTAGCASPSTSAPGAAAAEAAPVAAAAASSDVRKGMSAGELKTLLGEPKEIRPYVVDGVVSEIWVYERRLQGKTRQVVARMREVPFVDPITGVMRMIQEPVQENETTFVIEKMEVLMFSGAVAEWKKSFESERAFN